MCVAVREDARPSGAAAAHGNAAHHRQHVRAMVAVSPVTPMNPAPSEDPLGSLPRKRPQLPLLPVGVPGGGADGAGAIRTVAPDEKRVPTFLALMCDARQRATGRRGRMAKLRPYFLRRQPLAEAGPRITITFEGPPLIPRGLAGLRVVAERAAGAGLGRAEGGCRVPGGHRLAGLRARGGAGQEEAGARSRSGFAQCLADLARTILIILRLTV
jgi:hypothetical protein